MLTALLWRRVIIRLSSPTSTVKPLQIQTRPIFFQKSFPCLFPWGTGGPKNITPSAEDETAVNNIEAGYGIDSDIQESKNVDFTLRSWAKFCYNGITSNCYWSPFLLVFNGKIDGPLRHNESVEDTLVLLHGVGQPWDTGLCECVCASAGGQKLVCFSAGITQRVTPVGVSTSEWISR